MLQIQPTLSFDLTGEIPINSVDMNFQKLINYIHRSTIVVEASNCN